MGGDSSGGGVQGTVRIVQFETWSRSFLVRKFPCPGRVFLLFCFVLIFFLLFLFFKPRRAGLGCSAGVGCGMQAPHKTVGAPGRGAISTMQLDKGVPVPHPWGPGWGGSGRDPHQVHSGVTGRLATRQLDPPPSGD